MTLQKLIDSMLHTSTGEGMGDSGGVYGRHRQRNKDRDFASEPAATIEADTYTPGGYDYTINVYHYLTNEDHFALDDLCNEYNSLPCEARESDKAYGVSEAQEKRLEEHGFKFGEVYNTYNGDSRLGQCLQYTTMSCGDDQYILLQIHQGCDVRGGYTDAKLIRLSQDYMPPESVGFTIDSKRYNNEYDGLTLRDEDEKELYFTKDSKVEATII